MKNQQGLAVLNENLPNLNFEFPAPVIPSVLITDAHQNAQQENKWLERIHVPF